MDVTNFLQPELVEVNRLPARQPLTSYANVEQARQDTSRFRRSLDGRWRFKLVESPSSAPRRGNIQPQMTADGQPSPYRVCGHAKASMTSPTTPTS